MAYDSRPAIVRFFEKVEKPLALNYDPCWIWTGSKVPAGYGQFRDGRRIYAHRWVYQQAYGPIPKGAYVCHHCDNPSCVKPSHLFVGDSAANHADMVAKGRSTRHERNPRAKLTWDDVEKIRAMRAEGKKLHEIAPLFGVTPSNISYVCRKTWR